MSKRRWGNYWLLSGALTRLELHQIKRFNISFQSLIHPVCSIGGLQGLDFDSPMPTALLYQTGYLTIKDSDFTANSYTLGIPNNKVRSGLLDFLLLYYATGSEADDRRFSLGLQNGRGGANVGRNVMI